MFEQVDALLAEHADLQEQLADPALHSEPARAKKVNQRYAELSKIKAAHENWVQLGEDLSAAKELAREDESFADEVPALEAASNWVVGSLGVGRHAELIRADTP